MKYVTRFAFLIVLLFAFGASAAANGLENNLSNPHNLQYSTVATNVVHAVDPALGGTTEICVFCHTPHGATPQSILWNRNDIDPSSVSSFALYNSLSTLVIDDLPEAQYNTSDPAKYPNGATRMCLSCHDGSTAMGYGIGDLATGDSIAMTYSSLGSITPTPGSVIDLRSSHPVSFVYTDAIASDITGVKGAFTNGYQTPFNTDVVVLDSQSRMQCTTCHDPHDDASEYTDTDGITPLPPFWRNTTTLTLPNKVQAVCDDCHQGTDGDRSVNNPNHNLP